MLYAIVAVIALILDQAVKYWTTAHIVLNAETKELIPGFIHLANVHNTGAAFSFMEGARWFFVILCVVFVSAVIVLLAKNIINTPLARWMAVIVMAGAVGNCIDRVLCGYVVDMFEFDFLIFGNSFPVFNVADIFITVGGILFCLCILFEKEPKPVSAGTQPAGPRPVAEAADAPAAASAAPVREKRAPSPRRRQKTQIPDFPKHEHLPEPSVDPNDPFAEWERRAAGAKPAQTDDTAAQVRAVYERSMQQRAQAKAAAAATRPAPELDARQLGYAPAKPERQAENRVQPTVRSAQTPVQEPVSRQDPPAARPTAASTPASAAKPASDSYDLEDILAEFKDL